MTGVNTVSGDEHVLDMKKIHGGEIDESKVKAPNKFERAKEEFDAVVGAIHQRKSSRDESDKMEFKSEKPTEDENKKPNMMRKAKEEIKSLFHSKKNETGGSDSPKRSVSPENEKAGLGCSLVKGLENICAPWGDNKKD